MTRHRPDLGLALLLLIVWLNAQLEAHGHQHGGRGAAGLLPQAGDGAPAVCRGAVVRGLRGMCVSMHTSRLEAEHIGRWWDGVGPGQRAGHDTLYDSVWRRACAPLSCCGTGIVLCGAADLRVTCARTAGARTARCGPGTQAGTLLQRRPRRRSTRRTHFNPATAYTCTACPPVRHHLVQVHVSGDHLHLRQAKLPALQCTAQQYRAHSVEYDTAASRRLT